MANGQSSKLVYVLALLVICLVFYLAGPFTALGTNTIAQTNAETRLYRWLEAVAPPREIAKSPSKHANPAHAPVLQKIKPLVPFNPFPIGKPSSTHQRRSVHETSADLNEIIFSFQEDLDLPAPKRDLTQFESFKPHNLRPNEIRPTFATLLSTRNGSLQDPYFAAVRSLVYRMLWSPRTASKEHPFTVFVPPFVATQQKDALAGAGANVRELELVDWEPNPDGVPARLRDSFIKLNMWDLTEFSRIAFLDSDAFPIKNIDEVFETAETQTCKAEDLSEEEMKTKNELCQYVFAAGKNPGGGTGINGGVLVLQPNKAMHRRLMQNYGRHDYYDNRLADQGFLNWQFAQSGPFPAKLLPRKYNGLFPQASDEGSLSIVHHRIWSSHLEDAAWLSGAWESTWRSMIRFYDSEEFASSRQRDGRQQGKRQYSKTETPNARHPKPRSSAQDGQARLNLGTGGTSNNAHAKDSSNRKAQQKGDGRLDTLGLSRKQQKMLERHRQGKLPMDFTV